MPMSRPRNDEQHDEFMRRCHSEMHDEMPDDAQRNAVCQRQWEDKDKDRDRDRGGAVTGELLYPHVRAYVLETPWAILPGMLAVILNLLSFRAQGGRLTADEIQQRIGAASRPLASTSGNIAVLPLFGVIGHRMGTVQDVSGGTSVERFTAAFRQALAEPSIGGIILDVDSPGGTVPGVDELSAEIHRARGAKPIVAVANSLAASAAYWIATAAGEVAVIPTGEVGSIGVVAAHQDESGLQEKLGIKTTIISAGRFKREGNPFEPLTAEAHAAIESRVSEYYGMFVRAVARNRNVPVDTVRNGFGEGRVIGARAAVEMGMADRVSTLDDEIARMARRLRSGRAGAGAAAEADWLPEQGEGIAEGIAEIEAERAREAAAAGDADWRRRRLRLAGQK